MKAKTTPIQLGAELLAFTTTSYENEADREVLGLILKDTKSLASKLIRKIAPLKRSEPQVPTLLEEIFCLKVFAVDFGTYQALDDTPQKSAVLDSFYKFLRKECEDIRKDTTIFDRIKTRLLGYTLAFKTCSEEDIAELTPGWPVGEAFAKYCGKGKDAKTAMTGLVIFNETFLGVMDFISSFEIAKNAE